jgi:hypothetical protein
MAMRRFRDGKPRIPVVPQLKSKRCNGFGVLLAVMVLLVASCKTQQGGSDVPPSEVPSYAALADFHNARVAKLQQFYARGVIEIRWKDAKGNHFEQGDAELWISLPRHTALRVEKVGEVLLWLGSDDEQFWLFDLLGKEKLLHIGHHAEPIDAEMGGGALSVRPLALLDLMGLTVLPATMRDEGVGYDRKNDAWIVNVDQPATEAEKKDDRDSPAARKMRMCFDRTSLLPIRVEILAADGQTQFASSLRRYESVTQIGMSPLMFPKLPTLVDISSPGASVEVQGAAGEVKLAINEATGKVDDQPMDRVFDVRRLATVFKPQRIEGEWPP